MQTLQAIYQQNALLKNLRIPQKRSNIFYLIHKVIYNKVKNFVIFRSHKRKICSILIKLRLLVIFEYKICAIFVPTFLYATLIWQAGKEYYTTRTGHIWWNNLYKIFHFFIFLPCTKFYKNNFFKITLPHEIFSLFLVKHKIGKTSLPSGP